MSGETEAVLRAPVPGRMFAVVKIASWVELALFACLLVVWLAPGAEGPTAIFGLAHGLGFVALAILIWIAILRHEAPYTLLAATLTPVGPVGSVIAIHHIERRDRGEVGEEEGRDREGGHAARPCSEQFPLRRTAQTGQPSPTRRERPRWVGRRPAGPARPEVVGGAGPREAGGPHGPRHRQRVGSQGGMPTRSSPEAGLAGDEFS